MDCIWIGAALALVVGLLLAVVDAERDARKSTYSDNVHESGYDDID